MEMEIANWKILAENNGQREQQQDKTFIMNNKQQIKSRIDKKRKKNAPNVETMAMHGGYGNASLVCRGDCAR